MPVSRILSYSYLYFVGTVIYLGCLSPNTSSGTSCFAEATQDTALHSRKYFAVSAGLNRIVSVLNSRVTPDRRYLLRFSLEAHVRLEGMNVRTFLISLSSLSGCNCPASKNIIPHYLIGATIIIFLVLGL